MSKTKTYRLYAMRMSDDSISKAVGERFNRITPDYVLIYTDGEKPDNSVLLKDADASRLTDGDQRWLLDCNMVVIAEEAKKHEAEFSQELSERIDALEKFLKAEKEKLTGKVDDTNA